LALILFFLLLLLQAVVVAALAPIIRNQVVEAVVQAVVEKAVIQGQLARELQGKDLTAAVLIRLLEGFMEQVAAVEAGL
jgi:hypothetical protein